jgi:hypothetical protein
MVAMESRNRSRARTLAHAFTHEAYVETIPTHDHPDEAAEGNAIQHEDRYAVPQRIPQAEMVGELIIQSRRNG